MQPDAVMDRPRVQHAGNMKVAGAVSAIERRFAVCLPNSQWNVELDRVFDLSYAASLSSRCGRDRRYGCSGVRGPRFALPTRSI